LYKADLSEADCSGADLSNADMEDANLSRTNLSGANLSGARVVTSIAGVNLEGARLDGATVLGDSESPMEISTQTRMLDVAWNGANLANVRWDQAPQLGEEADIKTAETRQQRVEALTAGARAYRGLAKALQAQGLIDPALKYRKRQYKLERHVLLLRGKLGTWAFYQLLNAVSGYGDAPSRALACYIGVVSLFAAANYAITNGFIVFISSHSTHLQWFEALVLSISSFHGRGFFPSVPTLGDPVAVVAAAEAIIGLFIELVFIATFTQRFFAR
jgi:hypothetical protein